jgi:hypothetical protein
MSPPRAAAQLLRIFECQCRSNIRSGRYYAAGDGAARHPYHREKHTTVEVSAGGDKAGAASGQLLCRNPWQASSREAPSIFEKSIRHFNMSQRKCRGHAVTEDS